MVDVADGRAVLPDRIDVVVVGAGNAALCAALSAADNGARVVVLERAPAELAGGNTAFTGGGMRFPYRGQEDLLKLVPDLSAQERGNVDFGSYSEEDFYDDIARVTEYRADPDLSELLVTRSFAAVQWLAGHGVTFAPSYGRQAFKVGGRQKFWGGAPLEVSGNGRGLIQALTRAARRAGVVILYQARALSLLADDSGVNGVVARIAGRTTRIAAACVVLASGGFEANREWRARYLGPGWDLAKVRGSRFNTGDGIAMALEAGAAPAGHWSGCHAVGWDLNAPEFGDLAVGNGFNRHAYPLGIMVNAQGRRFVDEGADIRNFTYAKYGREILRQPGQFAWQIYDARVKDLLQRSHYRIPQVTRVTADTVEELAGKLDGVDATRCLQTIREFNAAATSQLPFDPAVKDGRSTAGLALPKSNWANPIDQPPYEAFAVTCGVTFTFGGLRVTTGAQVVSTDADPIPGLYACGELVGGLFYFNYPGNSGLSWGSVMGRIAGQNAAAAARSGPRPDETRDA
ncbi:MAG TPA: FAD-dependent tricarballylate dehydrogenase TcuA [Streptosporangiaceae bacterium]